MTFCIVGGTGFIGRHLCQHLDATGVDAFTVSRSPDREFLARHAASIRALKLDDPSVWDRMRDVEVLILLAGNTIPGSHWRSPDNEIKHDVAALSEFCQRAIETRPALHLVFVSSGGQIYGEGHSRPIAEDSPPKPQTSYALGKLLSEDVLHFFARVEGVGLTILRAANPAGIWQVAGRHGFVAAAVKAAIESTPLTIYGEGANRRDYFDADDFAALIAGVAQKDRRIFGTFNIGSGIARTELDVVALVEKILNRKIDVRTMPSRPFDLSYAVLDSGKAARALGWRATTDLETTIGKMARFQMGRA